MLDERERLLGAAAEFVRRYDWDWWCHLTFKNPPPFERAESAFRCWMNALNRRTFGNNYYRRPNEGLRWLRGVELQQRDAVHFHALVAGGPKPTCDFATKLWRKLAGDAAITVYDPTRGAARYLVKEYADSGNLELGGPWTHTPSKLSGIVESYARHVG